MLTPAGDEPPPVKKRKTEEAPNGDAEGEDDTAEPAKEDEEDNDDEETAETAETAEPAAPAKEPVTATEKLAAKEIEDKTVAANGDEA